MKRYDVIITVTGHVRAKVRAEDEDDALNKAEDRFWGSWRSAAVEHNLDYDTIEIAEIGENNEPV